MTAAKQYDLFGKSEPHGKKSGSHGGELGLGKRKVARPLDKKKPLHLVLKSSSAKGDLSLLNVKHRLRVDQIIREKAEAYGIKIHSLQNMGNHAHIVLSFVSRLAIQKFLRVVPGLIARLVTGAERGKAFGKRFFDHLAFTRVVNGYRDFCGLMSYMEKNAVEREDPLQRQAIEFYESLERKARRRGCDVDIVLDEWRRKIGAFESFPAAHNRRAGIANSDLSLTDLARPRKPLRN